MQLQTDIPATQATLETCLVYSQSPHPQNGDTGLSSRERSTGSMEALARLDPGKNEWGFVSSVQGRRRMAGEITVITCLSLRFDLGEHYSVQTIVFSNAQLGIKPPSAPWVLLDGAWGWAWGHCPLSLTNVLCFIVTLSSSPYGNISDDSRAN